MSAVRTVFRFVFPSARQLLRLFSRVLPVEPKWLEPALWITRSALLLTLYVIVLF